MVLAQASISLKEKRFRELELVASKIGKITAREKNCVRATESSNSKEFLDNFRQFPIYNPLVHATQLNELIKNITDSGFSFDIKLNDTIDDAIQKPCWCKINGINMNYVTAETVQEAIFLSIVKFYSL